MVFGPVGVPQSLIQGIWASEMGPKASTPVFKTQLKFLHVLLCLQGIVLTELPTESIKLVMYPLRLTVDGFLIPMVSYCTTLHL